jgi:integrase
LRYKSLGAVSRKEASDALKRKLAASGDGKTPTQSCVTFVTLARQWEVDVVPTKYKRSTQKNHRHIMEKHLIPRFGESKVSDVTTQAIQQYVTHLTKAGYAPKTIDHIHDVLSAILRCAAKWGHLTGNPARGVEMPRLKTVRPKWAYTVAEATLLLSKLPQRLPRAMVGVALLTGVRRGELFALRNRSFDKEARCLRISEAVYEGTFDDPNTDASVRVVPLPASAVDLIEDWRTLGIRTGSQTT